MSRRDVQRGPDPATQGLLYHRLGVTLLWAWQMLVFDRVRMAATVRYCQSVGKLAELTKELLAALEKRKGVGEKVPDRLKSGTQW